MPRERYMLTLTRPRGCSITRMKAYIAEAVHAWSGQYEPPNEDNGWTGDPLFGWEPNIVVRRESVIGGEQDEATSSSSLDTLK